MVGFDTATVYRTYDNYATDEERAYIEFCLRDAYEYYGYDFHYYDGGPVDEERIKKWLEGFTNINGYISRSWENNVLNNEGLTITKKGQPVPQKVTDEIKPLILADICKKNNNIRLKIGTAMIDGLYFVNKRGQPLRMMPKLELDPALLQEPLYH